MKIAILQNPAFRAFIFASLVTISGLLGFSISSYDKGGTFPVLLFLSEVLVGLGVIATLISLVVCLVMEIIQQLATRKKHTAS
jgi:hypothetical protein